MSAVDLEHMPVEDKLRLMESLWDSLCRQSAATVPTPDWHEQVLDERQRSLVRGEDTTAPWPEAKERIRAQIKSA